MPAEPANLYVGKCSSCAIQVCTRFAALCCDALYCTPASTLGTTECGSRMYQLSMVRCVHSIYCTHSIVVFRFLTVPDSFTKCLGSSLASAVCITKRSEDPLCVHVAPCIVQIF